jgi:hypothetical protein
MTDIEIFIDNLASVRNLVNSTNLYQGDNRESQIRNENLRLYLTRIKELNPSTMILGEAPGYKGCRLTGIPFTSERLLKENIFFSKDNYKFINDKDKLESEISATIVWAELDNLSFRPLIWNIFPFHPHQTNNNLSNRTPTLSELELGKSFFQDLMKIFKIQKVICLGREPESQLKKMSINYKYVRHPANGGKNKFVCGLRSEIKNEC